VKAGKLGRVGQVEIFSYWGTRRGKANKLPVPATLDWEFWSGPAPLLPYNDVVHPRGWRSFMAYGNGMVGRPRRAHARHGALDARPRDAEAHQQLRAAA
jgi:hypothetical protein